MNASPAEQVFEEVLPHLETLDAQIGGIVQLLKDKGITTWSAYTDKFGTSQRKAAPATWATINNGTSDGRIPARVSDKHRALVIAGFANEVDAVNQ